MNIFGNHVLAGRMGDSACARLALSWLILLRGAVKRTSCPAEEFVTSIAARYGFGGLQRQARQHVPGPLRVLRIAENVVSARHQLHGGD